jgi:RNA polymerase subunit RPABC4/transcription elongation factor Spt4
VLFRSQVIINEARTDWYVAEFYYAKAGDILEINVNATGGNAKLRVDRQDELIVFPEVQGAVLRYEIPIPSDDTYHVHIWSRDWLSGPFVGLQGFINQKRVVLNLFPMGYIGIGAVLLGLSICIGGVSVYVYEKRKIEKEKKWRVCPNCNQKVSIEKSICPFCGFDVTQSVRCKYCNAFYNRSLQICPNCGAKQSK